ncbi:hypothetical protein KCP69_14000 [Salmonella enterica subsp. enterica]|nr:hypothetical protein KCP69_14000 [Salmonella enterica subsp. enterica]
MDASDADDGAAVALAAAVLLTLLRFSDVLLRLPMRRARANAAAAVADAPPSTGTGSRPRFPDIMLRRFRMLSGALLMSAPPSLLAAAAATGSPTRRYGRLRHSLRREMFFAAAADAARAVLAVSADAARLMPPGFGGRRAAALHPDAADGLRLCVGG